MNVSDSSYVLPASLQPHYYRYVDDTFTCFTHCQMLTNPKNSCHLKGRYPNIRLTVEYPKLKTLRFLDCDVTIDQDNLSTSIYRRKKTFTCPGTDYNSFINSSFINNYVTTLNFLTNNGSPPYIFDNTRHKFLYIIFS